MENYSKRFKTIEVSKENRFFKGDILSYKKMNFLEFSALSNSAANSLA